MTSKVEIMDRSRTMMMWLVFKGSMSWVHGVFLGCIGVFTVICPREECHEPSECLVELTMCCSVTFTGRHWSSWCTGEMAFTRDILEVMPRLSGLSCTRLHEMFRVIGLHLTGLEGKAMTDWLAGCCALNLG